MQILRETNTFKWVKLVLDEYQSEQPGSVVESYRVRSSSPQDFDRNERELCAEFEHACRESGVSVEQFLRERSLSLDEHAHLLQPLIEAEISIRKSDGQSIEPESYRARFPGLQAGLLEDLFYIPDLPQRATESEGRPLLPARYRVLEQIGRGGIGTVWRVEDKDMQRTLAAKVLLDQHNMSKNANLRLEREALLTGSLQHPGIPPVYELGDLLTGGKFFTMKLVQGETLARVLETCEDFSDRQVYLLGILRAVAEAIGFAHDSQVIHRDLKPQNIMVGAFGEVQIMDWGMARAMDGQAADLNTHSVAPESERIGDSAGRGSTKRFVEQSELQTRQGEIFGTPAFMSPEQARGDHANVTFHSDVFALGAILFEILTGTRLYQHVPSQQILSAAADYNLDPSLDTLRGASVATELIQLCERCLAFEPSERPANGLAVASALSRHLQSVDKRLRQAEIDRSAAEVLVREEKKRRRTFLTMAAAVMAVTALGVCGIAWQWSLASKNFEEAQRQNVAREIYFAKSLEAIDRLLTRVSYETLKDVPGMGQLRKELLQDAQAFYQDFIKLSEQSSRVDLELARVRRLSGETYLLLGDLAAARDSLEKAVATLELLNRNATVVSDVRGSNARSAQAATDNSGKEIEFELVVSKLRLADTLYQQGEQAQSAEELRDVIARLEQSLQSLGASNVGRQNVDVIHQDRWQLVLAEARSIYADVVFTLSNSDAANEQRLLARAAFERVPDSRMPNESSLGYSRCLAALGDYERVNRRLDAAKELEQQAVAIARRIVEQHPDSPSFRSALVNLLQVQNGNLAADGYYEEAASGLVLQLEQQRRLIADFPNLPDLKSDLVRTSALYGSALVWLGRNELALKIIRDGLAIGEALRQEFPESVQYIRDLSFIQKKMAVAMTNQLDEDVAAGAIEHARAAYELDKTLSAMFPNDAADQYEYALSAELLSRELSADRSSDDEQVWREATDLMREAIDALELLVRDGSANSDYVSKLASLRVNFAYQLLIRKPDGAAEQLENSIAEFEQLIVSLPDNPRYRLQLARAHDGVAMLFLSQDRLEECEQALERALQTIQETADVFGMNAQLTEYLTVGRNRLAHCKSQLGKHTEVEALYQAALEAREQFFASDTTNDRLRVKVASSQANLAWLAAVWLPKEETSLRRGLEHAKKATKFDPDSQKHMLALAYLHLLLDEVEEADTALAKVEPYEDFVGLARLAILTLRHLEEEQVEQAQRTLEEAVAMSLLPSLQDDLRSRLTFPESHVLLKAAERAFADIPITDSTQSAGQ